jgi:hypothetical protein
MFVSAPGKIHSRRRYNQIEMRLLAHISGDELMKKAFISGEDIHTVTASQVFNVSDRIEVTPLSAPGKGGRQFRDRLRHFGLFPRSGYRRIPK